ncbi:immunity 52 family protein [Pseudomonas agarici]|nr:immunity 52 family protein [Pseudomonas agarici]
MTFAFVNITDKLPGKEFIDTYETDFCTFPHRKCVGWMAFVPRAVTSEQLPLAAEIIDIPGKGTVIVTVKEPFELTNMAHIRRANEIEMDMVDLDLLPLTDPSFL